MEELSKKEIENLVEKFIDKTLPKTQWTHEAHIVVALWHNLNYNFHDAIKLIKTRIKNYNLAIGTQNTISSGYHETLTIFWMIITKDFMYRNDHKNIKIACNDFLQSTEALKETPFQFYTKEILFSAKARRTWVNGNLKKLEIQKIDENTFRFHR
ncbi:hypothetical protein [Flavivirga jejuensis]|uniref:Uncharacterized protein n=1 Tax=Flavivirga jejuensis TaxID=870487 RepID=A0ABT8WHT7_9FLAO|nr:hypothetical protein [Flavivirga jejuensis]MDO5972705.1 hypothetical protein [Flavivirga jejuensis]